MYRVIYFKNTKNLHDLTACQNALRIPEVFLRLKQTLNELENTKKLKKVKTLFHLLSMDEDFFEQSSKELKSLNIDFWHIVMTIIQVGLYDRYLKSQMRPLGFITSSSSDWAARISGGVWTIKDMVENLQDHRKKRACSNSKNKKGNSNNHLSFFKYNEENQKYEYLTSNIGSSESLLKFIEEYHISQVITIGPSISNHSPHKNILKAHNTKSLETQIKRDWLLYEVTKNTSLKDNICVVDSIDIDPLLFWFRRDYNKVLRHKQNFSFIKSYFK